jgi:ParB/RepB/Spo0J family partition protein
MEVIIRPVDNLVMYENNPRDNDGAVDAVANSIKEFGFKVPILIDKNNVIIAGHTRLKAAIQLGMRDVPCILCDDLTPEQVRAFRIADNKVAEIADWDWPKLAQELDELLKEDVDLSITGFSDDEIERLTKNLDDIDISDFFSENESEAKSKEPQRIQCPHCGEWFDLPE